MGIKSRLRDFRAFGAEAARQMLEAPLYDLGIRLYAGGVKIASPRNVKALKMSQGHRGIWRTLEQHLEPGRKYVWIHAASLGEFEQGRPLMERIRREMPDMGIILTFFSPSGYEVRKNYEGADIVCYLPYDTARNARRWVETVRPEAAIFVKYEFWRNFLDVLAEKRVPTYLISAVFRPGQRFFRKSGSWYRAWLRCFTHIFVQNDASRDLLHKVGFDNVTVAGDTRFDRVLDIRAGRRSIPELEAFRTQMAEDGCGALMMFGSSWPADEDVYTAWLNRHSADMKAVIAPHEFDAARLKALKARFSGGAFLLSEARENPEVMKGCQVMIIDCFGLLSSAYAYADIAYVGGAFGAGLHNINEAAVFGIPVMFGPRYSKFIEAGEMVTLGGGISVDSRSAFERQADRLLLDREEREKRGRWAGEYIREKAGATDIIFTQIFNKNRR